MGARLTQRSFAGMLPRAHPTQLPDTMAARALDCRLDRGTLRALRDDRVDFVLQPGASDNDMVNVYHGGCCYLFEPCGSSLAWVDYGCNMVFGANIKGRDYPVQATPDEACDRIWCRLGLPCPPSTLGVSWLNATQTEGRVTARSFMYTYVNKYGQESVGSVPTPVTMKDFDNSVVLDGWVAPGPEYYVTHVNLYELRSGVASAAATAAGSEGVFVLVGTVEIDKPSFALHPTRVIPGPIYDAELHEQPPAELRDVRFWHESQLAGIDGRYVRFSEPRRWHAWPDKYRVETQAAPLRFFASQTFGYVLTCEHPEVFDIRNDCGTSGCRHPTVHPEALPLIGVEAATMWGDGVVYASRRGLVLMHGAEAKVFTEDIWTQEQWDALRPDTARMAVFEGYLFMTTEVSTFRIKLPSSVWSPPDRFDITELSILPRSWFVTRDGRLVYFAAGRVLEWGRGTGLLPYTYTSRTFVTPSAQGWGALKIVSDTNDVTLELVSTERTIYSGKVPFNKPMWVKNRFGGTHHWYTLRGTAEVNEIHIATDIEALSHE